MATPKFAHVGMDNIVQTNRVMAVIPPQLKTGRRYLELAKNRGMHIDASRGRLYRSLIIMDDGTVVTSAISVMTILKRFNASLADEQPTESYDDEADMLAFDPEDEEEE